MFIGHFAIGFGAKRFAPKTSLGTLLLATGFMDLLWPVLVLGGIETVRVNKAITGIIPMDFLHYPYSHSLLMAAVFGLAMAGIYMARTSYRAGAIAIAVAVLSHWALDFISHRPDMPLMPGSEIKLGLGLWDSLPATLIFEGGLFALGLALYLRATRPNDRTGSYALWTLVSLLVLIYIGSVFGPPPPDDPMKIALPGIMSWLFITWGYWIDKHRRAV